MSEDPQDTPVSRLLESLLHVCLAQRALLEILVAKGVVDREQFTRAYNTLLAASDQEDAAARDAD